MDEVKRKNFILINSLAGGGAERQVSLISNLTEIDKIILLEPIINYAIPTEKLIVLSTSKNSIFRKIFLLFYAPFYLRKIGLDKHTNLFCFLQLSYIIGFFCKIVCKCQFIICIRTSPIGFYKQYKGLKIPYFIYSYLLKHSNKVICNSATSALQLIEILKVPQAISIPNGYDVSKIQTLSQTKDPIWEKIIENKDVLITVGRLVHDKAQWHLIRVFAQLKSQYPSLALVLLGEGPLLEDLIELCKLLNLKSYSYHSNQELNDQYDVYFLGFQKNPNYYVAKSKLFLLPSLYEGLPNVVLESLLVNTPCVLSDCLTGPREILLPNSNLFDQTETEIYTPFGALLPTFNGKMILDDSALNETEKIWEKAILYFLSNPELLENMKLNCNTIKQKYSQELIFDLWKAQF